MTNLVDDYQPISGAFSEMADTVGGIRPHWQPLLNELNQYGPENISKRWHRAQRVIRRNGITYNLTEHRHGASLPWELDPIPLVIPPDEWAQISAGLIQRMQLLNLLLADIYGPQSLLRDGVLPSELVLANRAFLRPCCPIRPPDGHYLTMLAVDLARTPRGEWQVVKDQTQLPSGAGYALENRLIISRTFASMYRNCQIERLGGFFTALRDRLSELSPRKIDRPRIVILTPGVLGDAYFEHTYLSKYLGYPLVQGNDLTVRGNQVFLKTLGGLRQVDVILRRQQDTDCDPLELDQGSGLGIPGLVQAAIAGEVVIVNALGSGLAETPALLPFYPMLCRHLLQQEPTLWTVPTWWCGQNMEMKQVIDDLDRFVIKRAFTGSGEHPLFPRQLSPGARENLVQRITDDPKRFIAQENTSLSAAPCWREEKLISRHSMLRAFVIATRDGWQVMPGGLARISSKSGSTVVSLERGGGSKDTWIPATGEMPANSLLPNPEPNIEFSRGEDNLSSRVADNLYWLGRYVQRAEIQTRLLRTILRRLTEESSPDGTPELPRLLHALAVMCDLPEKENAIPSPLQQWETTRELLVKAVYDQDQGNNLYTSLTRASRIGTMVRDRISMDTWRILDRFSSVLQETSAEEDLTDIANMLDNLIVPLSAFSGLGFESMTHGYAWRFMDMGIRIERAVLSAGVLRELLHTPEKYEPPVLDALLEIGGSSITYRTRYQSHVALLPLLDLLITDSSNPRSIAFQLKLMTEHIEELSRLPREEAPSGQLQSTHLLRRVEQSDLSPLVHLDAKGKRTPLSDYLQTLIQQVEELSVWINERYLSHVQPSGKLASLVGGDRSASGEAI